MGDRFSTGKKNIMKIFDPMYALDLPLNPTWVTEKIIPAESPIHPHSKYLVKEQQKKAKKKRERRDAQGMKAGGRVKNIDGRALRGRTKGRIV